MLLSIIYFALGRLLRALAPTGGSELEREIELLVLRHQVKVLSRGARQSPFRRRDRMLLAAASRILPRDRWKAFLVTPRTLLGWHRELVRRKWTFRRRRRPGRPGLDQETVELIVRMARENPRWGYLRIRGELLKLGITVSATAIRTVLRRPRSARPLAGTTPREGFPAAAGCGHRGLRLRHSGDRVAEDALHPCLHRALHQTGPPGGGERSSGLGLGHPAGPNLAIDVRLEDVRFLIRDRDAKYSGSFDEVLRSEGVKIVKTPIRAPMANAFAERWVRTARRECLDHVLILGRRHLERTLREFVGHYNAERPHRGLQLACPSPPSSSSSLGSVRTVRRRDRLGGLIREYYREAA